MKVSILVLMSTYNGQEFVTSQIDSILNQKNVDVKLLIRDDGSKDNTVKIINSKYSNNSRVELILGKNVGCVNSFNELVKEAVKKHDFNYFSFSDQDDVWNDTKLISGIELLEKASNEDYNIPKAYCCNLMISDSEAKPICSLYKFNVNLNTSNMLVSNKATGCTMVFNRAMAQLYSEHPAKSPSYHDYWMGLMAVYFGKLYFDNNCHIFYRQHSNNVVGVHCLLNWNQRVKEHLNVLFSQNDDSHLKTLIAFYNEFKNEFSDSDTKKIKLILNYKKSIFNKIRILSSLDFYPDCPIFKNPLKHISFVLKVLFGKL